MIFLFNRLAVLANGLGILVYSLCKCLNSLGGSGIINADYLCPCLFFGIFKIVWINVIRVHGIGIIVFIAVCNINVVVKFSYFFAFIADYSGIFLLFPGTKKIIQVNVFIRATGSFLVLASVFQAGNIAYLVGGIPYEFIN